MSLYSDLLKRCLTRQIFPDQRYGYDDITRPLPYNRDLRQTGNDWPTEAVTMVGMERLKLLEHACISVMDECIPGDFVECGVWRGGCGILMRGLLAEATDKNRRVWMYDSFEGLPRPRMIEDEGDRHYLLQPYLAVPEETVRANLALFGLLDEKVKLVKGWFKDTLPNSEIGHISVLRLDGDMYESTWVPLESLYPKLSAGGYLIVDDYGALPNCKRAVEDYRRQHEITSEIHMIDWTGVFWRKDGQT